MEILYMLIPLSIVLVFVIGALFWWGVDRGQFDLRGLEPALLFGGRLGAPTDESPDEFVPRGREQEDQRRIGHRAAHRRAPKLQRV